MDFDPIQLGGLVAMIVIAYLFGRKKP
jgi:hypothetical protein